MVEVSARQSRLLDMVYPVVYLDGEKEFLRFWIVQTEGV